MGSYFQTCGLTNLPIRGREKVVVGFLVRTLPLQVSQCYPNHSWSLTPFFFDAVYDEGGNVENESGLMLDHMMNTILSYMVEREEGQNPYHEPPVKKKGLTIQDVIQASNSNRFFLTNLFSPNLNHQLKVIFFKKSVIDSFLETFEFDSWSENKNINFDFLCKRLKSDFENGLYQVDDIGDILYTGKKSYQNIFADGISFNTALGNIKPAIYFKDFFPFNNKEGKAIKEINPVMVEEAIRQYYLQDMLNTYMFELCGSWIPQMYGMTEIEVGAHKLREKLVNQEIKALGR